MARGVSVNDSRATRRFLARQPKVHAEVVAVADAIGVTARALFAPHDNPGGHHIEVDEGRVDAFVSLVGDVPWAVEYGHTQKNGEPVKGLHILGRAADV